MTDSLCTAWEYAETKALETIPALATANCAKILAKGLGTILSVQTVQPHSLGVIPSGTRGVPR